MYIHIAMLGHQRQSLSCHGKNKIYNNQINETVAIIKWFELLTKLFLFNLNKLDSLKKSLHFLISV